MLTSPSPPGSFSSRAVSHRYGMLRKSIRSLARSSANCMTVTRASSPRDSAGCPAPRVEHCEVGVPEDGSELVAEAEVGIPLGEGGAGDAGGLLGNGRSESRLQRYEGT